MKTQTLYPPGVYPQIQFVVWQTNLVDFKKKVEGKASLATIQHTVLIGPMDLPLTVPCLTAGWTRLGCGERGSRSAGRALSSTAPSVLSSPSAWEGEWETLPGAWGLISTRPLHRWACWCVVFHNGVPQQLERVRREGGTSSINPGTSQNKTNDSSLRIVFGFTQTKPPFF